MPERICTNNLGVLGHRRPHGPGGLSVSHTGAHETYESARHGALISDDDRFVCYVSMLGRLHVASDGEDVVRQLEKYTATVVDCLETVNRRLNGDPPSLSLDKMKQLDRGLAAAISEIDHRVHVIASSAPKG